jgi:subtilisin family serine protease
MGSWHSNIFWRRNFEAGIREMHIWASGGTQMFSAKRLVCSCSTRYYQGVKTSSSSRWLRALLTVCLIIHCFNAFAESKRIRLRNEIINTEEPKKAARTALPPLGESPVAGLFLVQFQGEVQPQWKEQLETMGVQLLRYVPDDAYIVRLNGVRLSQLRSISFVKWVGPYKMEHKIHTGLQGQMRAGKTGLQLTNTIGVSILFSPRATGQEIGEIRRMVGGKVQESHLRQGMVLRGVISPANLNTLAQSSAVLWVEPAPKMKLVDEVSSKIIGGDDGLTGTFTTTQQLGYTGAGVTVAVADSGLHNGDAATMHPDLFGRVDAFLFYGGLTDAADEHSHGTHVAGIIAGNAATGEADENGSLYGLGVAPESHLVAQRIFDGAGNYFAPPSYETLTRDAVRNGADIGSNSWGDDTQGRYDISAAEFDELVRDADALTSGDQPYILEFSAGNAGPGLQTIGSPAVAKNVIASGATESTRDEFIIYGDGPDYMADFSSRGPCEDGRIKPDVVAPGTWISSAKSASATDENAWSPISDNYIYMGGTSQAGPHVSGAAAVFVQYYRSQHTNATPSPALVKAALINSAVPLDEIGGTGPIPNEDEGWGLVDLTEIIGSPKVYDYVDQTTTLSTGQIFEHRTFIRDTSEPLRITMAYTDEPGFPGAIPALVNDLDLEVVAPDGAIYRGNQFDAGESVPNAPSADRINNVEAVYITTPTPGEYIVRVRARNVVQDARVETGAVDQDFALVISGNIPLPGQGVVLLDRGAYTAPSQMKITVIDTDKAGSPSVSVLVRSTTENNGENYTLLASGNSGVFTGAVATVVGTAAVNGKLEIHHGDGIEVRYQDVSAGVTRSATAVADLNPPVLTNIGTTNQFNRMVVTWTTDEPANSVVRYSTNLAFNLAVTNSVLTTDHQVSLDNLIPGVTYHFLVSSTDEAGNSATNNNAGASYSFVAAQNATVLVVDAYVPDSDSQTIPLSAYTDALAAAGISFDVWDVNSQGSPQLANLRPFPAVIWRVSDSIYTSSPYSNLSAAQQSTIQAYLNGGGSLFMSSMEILSRLGDVPFRRNVFQVAGFVVNQDPFGGPCADCDEDAGVPSIEGIGSDPITSGIDMTLDYSAYPVVDFLGIGPDFSDTFTPTTNAAPIIIEPSSGKEAGMRFPRTGQDSTGRVVFCSFPLDTLPTSGQAPNNEANFIRNVISFLVPGVNGLGTIALDSASYPVPGLVTVEVGDSDLAGLGHANISVTSSSYTNPVTVVLNETTRRGLFRGFFTLIPTNGVQGTNQLRAKDGDVVTVSYFDASANGVVLASAVVDTQPPIISGISAEPEYEDAVVSWDTTEASDSLVQFGESIFLGRTAYDGELTTSHSVTLTGLVPNRTYFYQVVSRDAAGNTVVDDNQGQFYTFHTQDPIHPPWFDNLETGATNWTVIDADGTEVSWTLGVPNNGLESSAHSPVNAWGSNLQGQSTDEVESFLVSPALDLTGVNKATLNFWHNYDFSEQTDSDILETGDLMIITNTTASPVTITTYGDFTSGWEQETIDLSPYVGHVVYLVWHYTQFSIDAAPRPGWLIDDVSVTVSNVVTGTIQISNNIAQGHFVLTGPVNQNGQGNLTVLSNAPPGQYVVTFSDVPYYQTPSPQTNTLTSSTTLLFQGNYTFADANHNGISDAWEQAFFGTVSANRTQSTDTDGDKMSDYAEFIAGTNPTNALSKLTFLTPITQNNGSVQLQWASVPGHAYQVLASTDLTSWTAVSGWIQANAGITSYTVTNLNNGSHLYRVQVRP